MEVEQRSALTRARSGEHWPQRLQRLHLCLAPVHLVQPLSHFPHPALPRHLHLRFRFLRLLRLPARPLQQERRLGNRLQLTPCRLKRHRLHPLAVRPSPRQCLGLLLLFHVLLCCVRLFMLLLILSPIPQVLHFKARGSVLEAQVLLPLRCPVSLFLHCSLETLLRWVSLSHPSTPQVLRAPLRRHQDQPLLRRPQPPLLLILPA